MTGEKNDQLPHRLGCFDLGFRHIEKLRQKCSCSLKKQLGVDVLSVFWFAFPF